MTSEWTWVVEAVYSRSGFFAARGGRIVRGGYTAKLLGAPVDGYGPELEDAIDQLAHALEAWVAPANTIDCGARLRDVRGTAARAVRTAVVEGRLREALGDSVAEPVLDTNDEPRHLASSVSALNVVDLVRAMRPV